MTKHRSKTAIINAIISADKTAIVEISPGRIIAFLNSADAYVNLQEEIDLPIVSKYMSPGNRADSTTASICWDWSEAFPLFGVKEKDERVKPYMFEGEDAQRRVDSSTKQEEDVASLIGGKRHPGSGAIDSLKSDASSDRFQVEAKQTAAASYSLTLAVLNKIYIEAKRQKKKPLVHVRFTKVPSNMTLAEDWIVIPSNVFEEMVKICGWK